MHIEKNICDNIVGTLLCMDKSNDTVKARLDLEDMGIREGLHLERHGTQVKKHLDIILYRHLNVNVSVIS